MNLPFIFASNIFEELIMAFKKSLRVNIYSHEIMSEINDSLNWSGV